VQLPTDVLLFGCGCVTHLCWE